MTSSFRVLDPPITVTASGTISWAGKSGNQQVFKLELRVDLSDLQRNMTGVLRFQLDRSDRCGERVAIQDATLAPLDPASLLTVQLHYERWGCAKAFGRQIVTKLVAGNGTVQVKLTPLVNNGTAVRLEPEVTDIRADQSLGEMLRSGSIGAMLRQKIAESLVAAIQKGANLNATLPPAVQGFSVIRSARFRDAGAGRLAVVLEGEIRLSAEQLQSLIAQLKARQAPR